MASDFSYEVKTKLLKQKKSQAWLIEEVKKKGYTGYLDSSLMSKLISSKKGAPEIKKMVCEILEIKE